MVEAEEILMMQYVELRSRCKECSHSDLETKP